LDVRERGRGGFPFWIEVADLLEVLGVRRGVLLADCGVFRSEGGDRFFLGRSLFRF